MLFLIHHLYWIDRLFLDYGKSYTGRYILFKKHMSLSHPVKYFYWPFQCGASFMDHLCYFCLVLLCFHARLFVDALWSPARKRLTSWLSFVMSNCDVVNFPCGILGQVWYLIVLITDLCCLSYFSKMTLKSYTGRYILFKKYMSFSTILNITFQMLIRRAGKHKDTSRF